MLEDKLYSITDIAKLTRLTDRTIRNYLVNGTLKGHKIGGQWRFTVDEVRALFSNDQFEEEMQDRVENKVREYYRLENEEESICMIINVQLTKEKRKEFFSILSTIPFNDEVKEKISFIDKNGHTKMVYIGPLEFAYQIGKLLKEVSLWYLVNILINTTSNIYGWFFLES